MTSQNSLLMGRVWSLDRHEYFESDKHQEINLIRHGPAVDGDYAQAGLFRRRHRIRRLHEGHRTPQRDCARIRNLIRFPCDFSRRFAITHLQFYWPVPLNGILMVGVTGSLEVICKLALFDPIDVGLKAARRVKLLPGLIVLLPPPLVIANMETSVPVTVETTERLASPLLLISKDVDVAPLYLHIPEIIKGWSD